MIYFNLFKLCFIFLRERERKRESEKATMPLVRFKIRNELSLGGPELNRSAAVEYEEPKAILGAVEVAGLVGILRQLGDLAE